MSEGTITLTRSAWNSRVEETERLRAELAAERADKTRIAKGWNEASDERDEYRKVNWVLHDQINALRELLREAGILINEAWADAGSDILARIEAALKGGE